MGVLRLSARFSELKAFLVKKINYKKSISKDRHLYCTIHHRYWKLSQYLPQVSTADIVR